MKGRQHCRRHTKTALTLTFLVGSSSAAELAASNYSSQNLSFWICHFPLVASYVILYNKPTVKAMENYSKTENNKIRQCWLTRTRNNCLWAKWYLNWITSSKLFMLVLYKIIHTVQPTNALKLKFHFLHTICHNSEMFPSLLIIFRELLNITKAYRKNPPTFLKGLTDVE